MPKCGRRVWKAVRPRDDTNARARGTSSGGKSEEIKCSDDLEDSISDLDKSRKSYKYSRKVETETLKQQKRRLERSGMGN